MAKRTSRNKRVLPPGARRAFVDYMHALLVDHDEPVSVLSTLIDGYSATDIYQAVTSAPIPSRDLVSQLAFALGGESAQDRALAAWAAAVKEERALENQSRSEPSGEEDPAPPSRPIILNPPGLADAGLSKREIEVLIALVSYDKKSDVARRLNLSLGTVNTYLIRLRAKYAAVGRPANTNAALVVRALQDGFVNVDDL